MLYGLLAVFLLARHLQREDQVDVVAGIDEAGDTRSGCHIDGDGAVAGVEHRGKEAAVPWPHQACLGHWLAVADAAADDGADEILELALTLDDIALRDAVGR